MNWIARPLVAAIVVAAVMYQANLTAEFGRLTYDSYRYLAGAESIINSGGYLDIAGNPQRVWRPGTSLLLASLMAVPGLQHG